MVSSQQGHKPYSVRVLTAEDLGPFRQLMNVFSDAFEDPEHYLSCPPEDTYIQGLLAGELFVAIAAFSQPDGSIVGGLTGYVLPKFEQPRSEFYLYDLAVLESCRRQGNCIRTDQTPADGNASTRRQRNFRSGRR